MHVQEDDKMWVMIENGYKTIEFDFAPNPEQASGKVLSTV